jgi:glycosyltransferase involved in cell wall biosynthesis
MKICYVSAFPPSERMLNEYAFHIVRTVKEDPANRIIVLADEQFGPIQELDGLEVVRVWQFNNIANPFRILAKVRELKPDVVWFNLLFATFGNQLHPAAAFMGLFTPALIRAAGYQTHITLHHLMDHIDLEHAGVRNPLVYRTAGWIATKALLMANSVTVLLPAYQKTLVEKYKAKNAYFIPHGIFCSRPEPPQMDRRGNPEHRLLAMGHWGTYKRLEMLMDAFPRIAAQIPNTKLVIAGCDHPIVPGYIESVAQKYRNDPRIEFAGYVPEAAIPELFRSTSLLLMPYSSSTGSSGVAHQAAEYGVPIVCADILDFREMAAHERLAIDFYEVENADSFVNRVVETLSSRARLAEMSWKNYQAAQSMTLPHIVNNYLQLFRSLSKKSGLPEVTEGTSSGPDTDLAAEKVA